MAGTIEGGRAVAKTNQAKYGSDFYKRIGSKGGSNSTGHAFAHGKVDPRVAGAKRGSISGYQQTTAASERSDTHGEC